MPFLTRLLLLSLFSLILFEIYYFSSILFYADPPPPIQNLKSEYIYRKDDEFLFTLPSSERLPPPEYVWNKNFSNSFPKITKDFFRCRGSFENPHHKVQEKEKTEIYFDCNGSHSLPLREGKEFIFPILIDLLNFLQEHLHKKVIITSGHRCPKHNLYCDPSSGNQYSKHQVGAEVTFYVQGMEERADLVIKTIQNYYQLMHKGTKEYEQFERYEKSDTNVSTPPWYNKEVFIKYFKKEEGRNFDNRHPYPYIAIQVRYDRELNERVFYTWDKANRNYHRW